jgi:hypothetical protein
VDKELNLIIKLAEASSNGSEFGRLHANLEKVKTEMRDIGQLQEANNARGKELLRQEAALEQERIRLIKVRADAEKRAAEASENKRAFSGFSNVSEKFGREAASEHSKASAATAELEKLEGRLKDVRSELSGFNDETNKLDDSLKKTAETGVRTYEKINNAIEKSAREVERHTTAKNKAYQKFFGSLMTGFQSLTSLAKSAALAYAAAMDTDDATVKKWMQWFAAIESVSQALHGIHGVYKSITGALEALKKVKTATIGINAALAISEAAVCKAQSCGPSVPGGGSGGGPAGGGWWGRAKGMAGRAARWAGSAMRGIGTFATGTGGLLVAGIAGGIAAGEAFNYATSGETLTGAVGEAWSARSSEQASRRRAEEMERRRPLENDVTRILYNEQINSRTTVGERFARDASNLTGTADAVAGMGWRSKKNQLAAMEGQAAASTRASHFLRGSADSMEHIEGGREQAAQLRQKAAEEEIQNIQRIIDMQRLQQQIKMDAARQDLDILKTRQQMAQQESEFFKALVEDAKREKKAVTDAVLGSKPGEVRRGFAARQKAEGGGELNYREAMALEQSGLATNEALRKAVEEAKEREAMRRTSGMPGAKDTWDRINKDISDAQFGSDLYGTEARELKADVKIAQNIVVSLENKADKEIDELIKTLEPALRSLLDERNKQVEVAIKEAIENASRATATNMTEEDLQNKRMGGGSR